MKLKHVIPDSEARETHACVNGYLLTKLAGYLVSSGLIALDANFRIKVTVAVTYFLCNENFRNFLLVSDLVESEITQRALVLSLGLELDAVDVKNVAARAYLSHFGFSHAFLADRTHRLTGELLSQINTRVAFRRNLHLL